VVFSLPIVPPSTLELYHNYYRKIISIPPPRNLVLMEEDAISIFGYSKKTLGWKFKTNTMGDINGKTWNPSPNSTVIEIELPAAVTTENLQEVQRWIDWWRPEKVIYK